MITTNGITMKMMFLTVIALLVMAAMPSNQIMAQEEEDTNDGGYSSGRYGSDSITCIMNISLYREFFKQWKSSGYKNETVKDAIAPWRWVFLNCPKGTQNTYIDGAKIMAYRIEKAKDDNLRNKLIDTLMMVYDQRIQYFNKEGYVLGRKGVDLATYRPDDYEGIFNTLKRSVKLQGNNSAGPVLVYYMRAAIDMVKNGKADSTVIFDTYDVCSSITDYNLKKGKDTKNWEIVQSNLEIAIEPYANCPALISIWGKKFEQTPDDVELLKKIAESLDKKKCQDDPLYFDVIKKLYGLEPTPASAYLIGKMLLNKQKYAEAIDYLKQADQLEDTDAVSNSYKYIAEAYRVLKNYSASRSYALKAASLSPNDGEPYMIIGNLYAESAKECGDNELTKRVAYWAAVDMFTKAKQVDGNLAEAADKQIAIYSQYFPSMETIFFYNLKEGDTYRVDCWIDIDTRVRAAKQ